MGRKRSVKLERVAIQMRPPFSMFVWRKLAIADEYRVKKEPPFNNTQKQRKIISCNPSDATTHFKQQAF
jgi:hypothetical protein